MNVRIYTDGGCSDNGKSKNEGSFGLVVVDHKDNVLFEHAEIVKDTTNNRMEMMAIIKAFKIIKLTAYKSSIIYSDSKYCVNGLNSWMHAWVKNGWKKSKDEIKNLDLWKELYDLYTTAKGVTIQWIKGHQNENNWNNYIDRKIVSLREQKEEIIMTEEIIIDLPLDDLENQRVDGNWTHQLTLYPNYMKYYIDFCSEELDEDAQEEVVNKYEGDSIMSQIFKQQKPQISVCREQISFSNREDIVSVLFVKSSEDKENLSRIVVTSKDSSEFQIIFKDHNQAKKVLKTIQKWRWS